MLSTKDFFPLAAIRAASLHTFAISAPEKPGVWRAKNSESTDSSILMGRRCTLNISFLSFRSGKSTVICLSNRPALSKALSRMSARLVAANIITPLLDPNPSISVNSWFSVFSRSSLDPMFTFLPRARPTASISSMKIMLGAFSFACLNKSRTRDAPTPTNISTKSDPEIEKNGTSASPATALANNVLPVPGGPTSSAPLGIFPPKFVYFLGCLKNSTTSSTSCLASDRPATSLKVTLIAESLSKSCALDLPTLNTPPPPPPAPPDDMRRIKNTHINIRSINGAKPSNIPLIADDESNEYFISNPFSSVACLNNSAALSAEGIVATTLGLDFTLSALSLKMCRIEPSLTTASAVSFLV